MKAVVFDIDGTLTPQISWLTITEKLQASVDKHDFIYKEFKKNKILYKKAKEKLINLWRETGKANKDFFTKIFKEMPLKKEAKEIIDYFKLKGILVCLITGSVDLYAEIIANRLNVKNYYSNTQLIWDKKGELIDFNYDRNQGEKKLKQFKDFCLRYDLNHKDILIVGDDENDINLFKYTNHGIAVKSPSSHKLEQYAWKTVVNLSELKKLV